MNDKEKENEKNNDKDLKEFSLTNFKDFEIKKELNISNEYIKIYKVLRKIDKKYYILLKYPLNIVTNDAKNFQKLVGILEIIKILLKKINHTNVLNIKESFIEKEKSSVIMILELYDNKTIYNSILSIEGLSILHKNNIFNINLSPKNIYIDEKNNLKLNPYISLENLSSTKFCNNTYFRIQAPELSKNSNNYTTKTDIWYLGLLIYEITQLESMNNYFYDNYDQIYNYIIRGNYPFNNYYTNDIKELIKLCLQYSHNRRPSAVELLKIIDLYKKNRIINERLDNLKIKKKSNKLQKKINLREEIDKFNQTLAKIKNYENKPKVRIYRDMTPVISRKHSNYNINENDKYNVLENNRLKIFKKPLKLKTCFINNNKLNIPKTGKKFFGIHKNNETMKGYLQTQPFDIKKFVVKNPSYFQYEKINYRNNRFKSKNKSFNILNNIEDNSRKDKSVYLHINKYNINEKYFRRSNSFNFCKINKNQGKFIYGKNKIVLDKIKTKYFSPFNKNNKKLCKSFYLPYEKSIK